MPWRTIVCMLSFFLSGFTFSLGACQGITETVNPRWCMRMKLGRRSICKNACICSCVWDRMHVHMCICVSFILAFALSSVTSVPYASPGLTQYAHTDEITSKTKAAGEPEMQMSYAHTTIHTQTHTSHTILSFVLHPLPYPLPFVFAISVISKSICVCVCVVHVFMYVGLIGGDSRLHCPPFL